MADTMLDDIMSEEELEDDVDDDDRKMPAEPDKEGIPRSKVPLSKVLQTIIGLGEQYNRGKDKKFANELLVAAVNYLEEQVFDKHDKSWLDGTLFGMLAEAFPGKLNHIIETFSDKKINQLFKKGFFGRAYEAAYIDGDGTICGHRTDDRMDYFDCGIDISPHAPFFNLLTTIGGYDKGVVRIVNDDFLADPTTITAFNYALVLKNPQFLSVLAVSPSARLGLEGKRTSRSTPMAKATGKSLSRILSALNNNHGIGFSSDYYENSFRRLVGFERKYTDMDNPAPILFLVYLAGIIGSDGCVGEHDGRRILIIQSNRNYLLGLHRVAKEVFGLDDDEECYVKAKSSKPSSNARKSFDLVFRGNAMKRILPFVAAFDYNRRTQHLLFLILQLVKDCDESQFSNKRNVVTFLLHVLIIIRIYYPSKKKTIIITIAELVEIVTRELSCFQ